MSMIQPFPLFGTSQDQAQESPACHLALNTLPVVFGPFWLQIWIQIENPTRAMLEGSVEAICSESRFVLS
jgi:hypothetical protein